MLGLVPFNRTIRATFNHLLIIYYWETALSSLPSLSFSSGSNWHGLSHTGKCLSSSFNLAHHTTSFAKATIQRNTACPSLLKEDGVMIFMMDSETSYTQQQVFDINTQISNDQALDVNVQNSCVALHAPRANSTDRVTLPAEFIPNRQCAPVTFLDEGFLDVIQEPWSDSPPNQTSQIVLSDAQVSLRTLLHCPPLTLYRTLEWNFYRLHWTTEDG